MSQSYDLAESAADAVAAGDPTGIPSAAGMLDGVASAMLQGSAVTRAGIGVAAELARIAMGTSEVTPARGDWRFKDPTWTTTRSTSG